MKSVRNITKSIKTTAASWPYIIKLLEANGYTPGRGTVKWTEIQNYDCYLIIYSDETYNGHTKKRGELVSFEELCEFFNASVPSITIAGMDVELGQRDGLTGIDVGCTWVDLDEVRTLNKWLADQDIQII